MESKNLYIIIQESVLKGFSSTRVLTGLYEEFNDAAVRMTEMLLDERKCFSDEAKVSFSGNDQCWIYEAPWHWPDHSVTLRIEKYMEGQSSDGYNAVDLGLSVKWCDRNVGAVNAQECGDYFMWGSTTPNTNNVCNRAHAPFNGGVTDLNKTYFNAHKSEWITENGTLKPEYDAAHVIMGGSWRMPTSTEMDELFYKTIHSLETLNGIVGMRLTSIVNGNSIFMPFAGGRYDSDTYEVGEYGYMWSSSLSAGGADYSGAYIIVHHGGPYLHSGYGRVYFANYGHYQGFIVRGVHE